MVRPVRLANCCSSHFHSRSRAPLLPPASAVIKSRATDEAGVAQPTRDKFVADKGTQLLYHYNAIQAWQVESTGEVKNVYA